MNVRIAESFADSLGGLCSDEQKTVKTTAFDRSQRTAQPTPLAPSITGTGVPPSGTTPAGTRGAGAGTGTIEPPKPTPSEMVPGFRWTGEITPQKWMNFYMKVLAGLASTSGLKLTVTIDAHPERGLSKAKIEEIRIALRELGLPEEIPFICGG